MATSIKLLAGATIHWHRRQYVIVGYAGLDAIVGQEFGKRNVAFIPVAEAQPDGSSRVRATATPDLISVPENSWRSAVEKFEALRVLYGDRRSETNSGSRHESGSCNW
jgi:hypothetical protein